MNQPKQSLGLKTRNWVAKATTRTAPLIFFIYDLVLLWYAQSGYQLAAESALDRSWYPQKGSVSFEDILRTLRYATWQERIFSDPTLDAKARKILQPLVEWAKGLTLRCDHRILRAGGLSTLKKLPPNYIRI